MPALIRSLFNSTFKTNPYMERAVMAGITRVSKESVFSDLNNLKVVTTTSDEYADVFGFTEEEVFLAMDEFGMENKEEVKAWYGGFTFGEQKEDDAYILEFKACDPQEEESLADTVKAALMQIEEKQYEAVFLARGMEAGQIRKYGFAFEGKTVLIG